MIVIGNHSNDIVEIHYQGKNVVSKYYGLHLVWEAVKSCYGKGYWIETKPWLDDDKWKDNK